VSPRRRVLFVGRTRYRLPLDEGLARKWDALSERLDVRVLGSGSGSDARFRLVSARRLEGPRFYLGLPVRIATELRSFTPEVVIAKSPYEAAAAALARALARSRASLIVEVHGDWRTATRLYGSSLRRPLAPVADAVALWGLRRADAVRTLSPYTSGLVRELGIEPAGEFATYSDLGAFDGPTQPLPAARQALFVGVLERYKNVQGLAEAWRLVADRLPEARLRLVGSGTEVEVAESLERAGARWDRRLEPAELARALDESRLLVLPSSSEGLGRVIVEAFLRGRPVVATRVGGIPDLVEHEANGLLVPAGDVAALAGAIERVLRDDALAAQLGNAARSTVGEHAALPDDYAEHVRTLVEDVLSRTAPRPSKGPTAPA
jgi:glycosyltransferase involved in cell wall biosynthesis